MTTFSTKRLLMNCILLAAAMVIFAGRQQAYAKVEFTPVTQTDLGVEPLDVATSLDGKTVFVLTKEEILVYSAPEKKILNRIRLSGNFDRVSYSAGANLLVLTSSSTKTLKMIKVETIQEIDITGHPFRGPVDAPVILAVFDDYQ